MTIAELNDAFRRSLEGGELVLTRGVDRLPWNMQDAIIERVRSFETFTKLSDPLGEHDFGVFDHGGQDICWQIVCYDLDRRHPSPDPTDPSKTVRVLTIELGEQD